MAKNDVPALAGLDAEQLQECLVLGASFTQIKDLAEAGFGYAQIKSLATTLGSVKSSGNGLSSEDLKSILSEVAAGQRKAMKPENDQHPGISVFSHPEGEIARPKAAFRFHDVFFNGSREREEQLTPAEVDLFNRFDKTRTSRNGNWRAEIRRDGEHEALLITTAPFTRDALTSLPPMTAILRELLDGEAAVNPDMLNARLAELEAQIKSMANGKAVAA